MMVEGGFFGVVVVGNVFDGLVESLKELEKVARWLSR